MLHYVKRICVFIVAAAGLFAQTVPVTETRTTGAVGIAQGQTARFNVFNIGDAVPAMCSAVLTYYDGGGTLLKTAAVAVAPGTIGYLDLFSVTDLGLAADQRKQIRATFTVPLVPPASATATSMTPVCTLIGTLEILDTLTGKTSGVLGGMHTVPITVVTPAAN